MTFIELTHRYFNFFVEPMKRWFPTPVYFWRPDNKDSWWAWREKPLGYWLGHVVGYLVIIAAICTILVLASCAGHQNVYPAREVYPPPQELRWMPELPEALYRWPVASTLNTLLDRSA